MPPSRPHTEIQNKLIHVRKRCEGGDFTELGRWRKKIPVTYMCSAFLFLRGGGGETSLGFHPDNC